MEEIMYFLTSSKALPPTTRLLLNDALRLRSNTERETQPLKERELVGRFAMTVCMCAEVMHFRAPTRTFGIITLSSSVIQVL